MLSSTKSRFTGKKSLQIFFFFLLVTQICFAQWYWQNPLPQGNNLNDVDFIDENNGIAVGEYGIILRTTDGGINWTIQESGTTNNLNGVCFTDASTGYAVGELGIILKTKDGGITWAIQQYGLEYYCTDVCFVDANTGWIVNGWMGNISDTTNIILHTTDGGINWVQQTYNSLYGAGLLSVYFLDENTGYAAGYYGSVFKTTDGGENWQNKLGITGSNVITDIHFVDANNGWAVQHRQDLPYVNNEGSTGFSEEGQILHTIDGGNTWTVQMDTLNAYLFGIEFLDSSFGFAVGETPVNPYGSGSGIGIILGTEDGGTNWTIINTGISMGWGSTFKDFCFTNEHIGILVGNSGVILKSSNDGEIWDLQLNGTTNNLTSIAFSSANTGFVVGQFGTIMRTIDGGAGWITQTSGTTLNLTDICFADEYNGWIVGASQYSSNWGQNDSSIILHTSNGGMNWLNQKNFVGDIQLFDLFFVDEINGWAVGAEYNSDIDGDGLILRTTDGGINWVTSTIQPITRWFHSVYFIDSNIGWACGEGAIIKTTNGGTSWITQFSSTYKGYGCIYFTDENNGWAVGSDIIHTTDGGSTWFVQNSGTSLYFTSVYFVDADHGWVSSIWGTPNLFKTTNGGTTWSPHSIVSHRLNEFYFEDLNNGWIVGENGTILHTTNGGNPVPIKLISFAATANNKEITLNWSTATELNNQGFEVQRKFGSNNFLTIGSVKGHGTTTSPNNYTYIDKLSDAGKYFYRLKQIDYGGKYEYSQVVEVNWSSFTDYKLEQNYPNPFNPTSTIGFGITEKGNVRLSVLNVLGEEIKVLLNEEKEAGYHSVNFDASNLPSGVYFYHLKVGEFTAVKKLILLK